MKPVWITFVIGLILANICFAENFYSYDKLNRLTTVVEDDGTTVTYTYDDAGNRLSKTVVLPEHPPNAPSSPSPGNGADSVLLNTGLSWTGGDPDSGDTVTYDVYFDSVNPPVSRTASNQTASTYQPASLIPGTSYFWKIVSRDSHGEETPGPVWSFATVQHPTAAFTATPSTGIFPLSVSFANKSTGIFTTSSWDFGDGTQSSAPSVSHLYSTPGKYTASLTVTGPGGTNTATSTIWSQLIHISGGAYNYPSGGTTYQASFSMDVTGPSSPSGWLKYSFAKTRMTFASTKITQVLVSGNAATINGTGTVNNVAGYTFTAVITDSKPDSFGITIKKSDGSTYYSSNSLNTAGGDLVISLQ